MKNNNHSPKQQKYKGNVPADEQSVAEDKLKLFKLASKIVLLEDRELLMELGKL